MMMKKTLLAVAMLGAVVGAQAEETAPVVGPYAGPFAYGPVSVNEELIKAQVEYQRQAYEHFVAQQKLARENTPEFLRIPAVPARPAFEAPSFEDMTAMSEQMREEAMQRSQAYQQSFAQPMDIEKALSERQKELDAALADAEKRADELAKAL